MDEAQFRERLASEGCAEVVEVTWPAGTVNETHSHDFGASILVLEGAITVTLEDRDVTCRTGDTFALDAGVPHAESVGADGVRFLVGRR